MFELNSMNCANWSEVASSTSGSLDYSFFSLENITHKEYSCEFVEVLSEIIEEPKNENLQSIDEDHFDSKQFLDDITTEIIELERKKDELLGKALDFNLEATTQVFALDCLTRKLRLGNLISQLEGILDGSDEIEIEENGEHSIEESVFSSLEEQPTDTESSASCKYCGGSFSQIIPEIQIWPNELQLEANVSNSDFSRSITFELDEGVAEKWVTILHKQFRDFEDKEKVKELGTPETIEVLLKILRLYVHNSTIADQCALIMQLLAASTAQTCRNVLTLKNGLEMLCECFDQAWPYRESRQTFTYAVIGVFFHTTYGPSLVPFIQRDDCLELLLKTCDVPGFHDYDILSVVAAVNLIQFASNNWTFRLTREKVDATILKGLSKWQLGVFRPVDFGSFFYKLTDVQSENLAIQQFSAWILANETTINPERHCATIRKQGGVPILERVHAKEDCNPEVARLVKIVLEKVQMSEGLIYIAHDDTI